MKTTVKATYRDGALMPEVPLDLEDGDEVTLTVENTTTAIERFGRARQQTTPEERLQKMEKARKHFARLLKDAPPAIDHGELLYDENGLPK